MLEHPEACDLKEIDQHMDFNEAVEEIKAHGAAIMELQKDKIERDAISAFKQKLVTAIWEVVKAVLVPAAIAYFTYRAARGL